MENWYITVNHTANIFCFRVSLWLWLQLWLWPIHVSIYLCLQCGFKCRCTAHSPIKCAKKQAHTAPNNIFPRCDYRISYYILLFSDCISSIHYILYATLRLTAIVHLKTNHRIDGITSVLIAAAVGDFAWNDALFHRTEFYNVCVCVWFWSVWCLKSQGPAHRNMSMCFWNFFVVLSTGLVII